MNIPKQRANPQASDRAQARNHHHHQTIYDVPWKKISTVATAKGPGFLTIKQRTMGEHGRITTFAAVARCRDSVTSYALFGGCRNKIWNSNGAGKLPRKLTGIVRSGCLDPLRIPAAGLQSAIALRKLSTHSCFLSQKQDPYVRSQSVCCLHL